MISEAARIALQASILEGHLIPVTFTMACDDLDPLTENAHGYCLHDSYTRHSSGESDCFGSQPFLLRPSYELMEDFKVQAAYKKVHLDNWTPNGT